MQMSQDKINTSLVQAGCTPANGKPRVAPIIESAVDRFTSDEKVEDIVADPAQTPRQIR